MPPDLAALNIADLNPAPELFIHDARDLHVSQTIREQGVWEPYETALVLQLLGPGDCFVDVGANIGYFSIVAGRRVGPGGQVWAFEPDPDNFALLQRSVEHNSLGHIVHAAQAGLAATEGGAQLYLSADNLGDHQLFPGREKRPAVTVALHRGDSALEAAADIDLIKIDVQGYEHEVMQGLMPRLVRQATPPQVLIELTPFSLRQAGSSGRELINALTRLNQPFWIVDHIEHELAASSAAELAQWCDNVDNCAGDEGFMNILVGRGV